MPMYTVTTTIQSPNIDENAPVDVTWYTGDSLAKAVSAMASAATHDIDVDHGELPASVRYRTLNVSLRIEGQA